MEYLTLTEDEQHDMLVQTLAAQERDHWLHSMNKDRVTAILAEPTLTPDFRKRMTEFLRQTNERIHEVTHIIEKLRPQLPSPEKIAAAHARLRGLPAPPPRP